MQQGERRYYVYVYRFIDSDEVFYVGKGTGRRYKQRSGRCQEFLDAVKTKRPIQCTQYINLTEAEALEREKQLIAQYKKDGHPLINVQHVGGAYLPIKRRINPTAHNAYEAQIMQLAARYSNQ